jgi:hypothetical protein
MPRIRVRKTIEYEGDQDWVMHILSRSIVKEGHPNFETSNCKIRLIEQSPIEIIEEDKDKKDIRKCREDTNDTRETKL